MSFPTSPSNNQVIVVSNISYQYSSVRDAWVRVPNNLVTATLSNLTTGNIYSSNYYWANGTPFVSSTYGNTEVAAYLIGNITTGNVGAAGYYFANGAPFTSSNYGDANVSAYLAGNITAGNITATGNIVGGGVRTTTGSTEPTNPVPGDMWYDTANDVLFRYTDLGTGKYWLDIAGETMMYMSSGNVTFGNVAANGYYFANGTPFASSNYGNTDVAAYLSSYYTYANANAASQQTSISTLQTQVYSNTNVAAYLTGNVTTGNVAAAGYYFANGAPLSTGGSTYGNSNVAAYLSTYSGNISANYATATGNITAGNIITGGVFWANGTPFTGVNSVSSVYSRTSIIATAGQTVFNVAYTVGYLEVYFNGALLNSTDYTASNGSTVTLTDAAAVGDILEFVAYNLVPIANVPTATFNSTNITSNLAITAGYSAVSVGPINIANGVTVTIADGQKWVIL